MRKFLIAAAAPLFFFAVEAQAQTLTATGSCTNSDQVDAVLRDSLGATGSRVIQCDTMVSVPGKSVTYTRKSAPQDRTVFAGVLEGDDLSIQTITLGTGPAVPVLAGFCNGGPVGDEGLTAMVCSAVYEEKGQKIGISVVFTGMPK